MIHESILYVYFTKFFHLFNEKQYESLKGWYWKKWVGFLHRQPTGFVRSSEHTRPLVDNATRPGIYSEAFALPRSNFEGHSSPQNPVGYSSNPIFFLSAHPFIDFIYILHIVTKHSCSLYLPTVSIFKK